MRYFIKEFVIPMFAFLGVLGLGSLALFLIVEAIHPGSVF